MDLPYAEYKAVCLLPVLQSSLKPVAQADSIRTGRGVQYMILAS